MKTFALVAVLVTLGCAGPAAAPTPGATATPLAVALADFYIEPSSPTVSGPRVLIDVSSAGPTPHNLTIRDSADAVVLATRDLRAGEVDRLEAELPPGEYTIFCALAGHESLGMRGTLTVTE